MCVYTGNIEETLQVYQLHLSVIQRLVYSLMKPTWNFEFRGTQNDWMEISQNVKLIFLASATFERSSAKAVFSRYLKNQCNIQSVSEVVCNKKFEYLHSVSIKLANFFSVIEGSSKFFFIRTKFINALNYHHRFQ